MSNSAWITGTTAPSATSGHRCLRTSAMISALLPVPVAGRLRTLVACTLPHLPSSAPTFSSPLTPPCIPMITR
ncbi:Uncharacterised protein [Mycobacteroides abscessus subsp. abscessus]|nr:Uncharacterised protein [Mycobacteroides abscessus subsp. abscessus]